MLIIGLDPGGKDAFGWCIAEQSDQAATEVLQTGVSNSAADAIEALVEVIGPRTNAVQAAGIDSPLFWSTQESRVADITVRRRIKELGAPNASGTVQNINSLRGACLAQGIIGALLLRQLFPNILLTESHPKALLWLIGITSRDLPEAAIDLSHLRSYVHAPQVGVSQHERDAVLGAVAAAAMVRKDPIWRDLFLEEPAPYVPVQPVSYFLPNI